MTYEINETHDINLKSWIESANAPDTDFPIQNLPFCSFRTKSMEQIIDKINQIAYGKDGEELMKSLGISDAEDQVSEDMLEKFQIAIEDNVQAIDDIGGRFGVAIGDKVLDLENCIKDGLFDDDSPSLLNSLILPKTPMERKFAVRHLLFSQMELQAKLRERLIEIFREDADEETKHTFSKYLYSITDVTFGLPTRIGDYTDFYCSIFHATNVGAIFRPDNPLLPNYKYIPIGYHGRASSIVVSGTDVKRPKGQNRADADAPPVFIPAKNLDYEMEVGFFVGKGNTLGESIPIENAEEHIFGLCLVNDWSARDIQAWEYQPLGPFLAKNFATTVSPFVVTMEALAPFRTNAFEREEGDPQPLDYLNGEQNKKSGGFDIKLEVYLQTEKMREENTAPFMLSRSNMKDLYWTIAQMLTHHASNGCNLQTGDLMATGTVSGKGKDERGCLLELTWRGKEPIDLPNGEQRRFLEDGDEIIMRGFCEREGFRRIGFGECRGKILPAE
ncbi:MAG TPA: fumarylacetoacetase [Pyrinomonadaceae bacterium]|nr:fumarylacetoacetase [Pyrinomonadaceae bacterium]